MPFPELTVVGADLDRTRQVLKAKTLRAFMPQIRGNKSVPIPRSDRTDNCWWQLITMVIGIQREDNAQLP